MFFERSTITHLFSHIKKFLGMSSTVDYTGPESFDGQDHYTSKAYGNILMRLYDSLEHAEGCRIVEVTGWKHMKAIGQHEFTVVTIERDGKTAYVRFERGPGKATKPIPSLSSMDSISSTNSVVSSLAVSRQSSASDRVTFSSAHTPSGAEKIWRIDFEDNPPFYMAVNFATTILKDNPFYDVTGANCYFFTLSLKEMFLKHCNIREHEEILNRKYRKTQAGRTMGIRTWNPKKLVKQVAALIETQANSLPELQEFCESLEKKVAENREKEEKHEREMHAKDKEL
ncbi:hypothetical protein C0992_011227, partial [Termitomyces sp. T32_za158]